MEIKTNKADNNFKKRHSVQHVKQDSLDAFESKLDLLDTQYTFQELLASQQTLCTQQKLEEQNESLNDSDNKSNIFSNNSLQPQLQQQQSNLKTNKRKENTFQFKSKKKGKKIEEEYFIAPNPQDLWKKGVQGTTIFLALLFIYFDKETALLILKIKLLIWLLLIVTIYSWDVYFLRFSTEDPNLNEKFEYETTKNHYFKLKTQINRNIVRYKIHTLKDCFWFSTNISLNLLLCNYCRAIWYAQYWVQMILGVVDNRLIHSKSSYFFVLNTSLYQYIRQDGKMVFQNVTLPVNNYGTFGVNKNLEARQFEEMVFEMDHDKETIISATIKQNATKPVKTLTDKFEIHTLLLQLNTFAIHLQSHILSNLANDLDEEDFTYTKQAKIATNGLNSAGLWITKLIVHGPSIAETLVNNGNLGLPHYPTSEKAPWLQKSQIYHMFKAIMVDKEVDEIAQKYIDKSLSLSQQMKDLKVMKAGIACHFALHGIDHWVHDRFCMPYVYNDYLKLDNTKQAFWGGRWNCDIVSNFNKPCGKISEIVYRIIRETTPQLLQGFQWTLRQ